MVMPWIAGYAVVALLIGAYQYTFYYKSPLTGLFWPLLLIKELVKAFMQVWQ